LKRLEKDGHILSYWGDAVQGGRRKYYKITEQGKSVYKQNKENWEQAKKIIDLLL
jgi:PadR family transcriptional regulator PadR